MLEDRRLLAAITVTSLADGTLAELAGDGQISLREAIQAANTDTSVDGSAAGDGTDMILFDSALSGGTINLDLLAGEIDITTSITIDATALADKLIIHAGGGVDGVVGNADGFRHFTIDDGTPVNVEIQMLGLRLTGGDVAGKGGAIFNRENLLLRQAWLAGNSAYEGGAIYTENGVLTLENSHISSNLSVALGVDLGSGGGIALSHASLVLTDSLVDGNISETSGGGIWADNATVDINSSSIADNESLHSEGGGGLYLKSTELTVRSSTISGNSAPSGGGIYTRDYQSKTILISDSTISNNHAQGAGGGLAAQLFHGGSIVSIARTTITHNSAVDGGGVLFDGQFPHELPHIENSLIAGNTAITGVYDDIHNTQFNVLQLENSLIGNSEGAGTIVGAGNLLDVDPLLGPLADNGGPTLTHALLPGSPAINAGDPAFVPPPDFDQRGDGFPRVVDGRIDIGAVEASDLPLPGPTLVVDLLDDESDGNFAAGDLSLREAVFLANLDPDHQTITFDPALAGGTIALSPALGQVTIATSMTLDASMLSSGATIRAPTGSDVRIFRIDDGNDVNHLDVEIVGLTLTGADITGDGGAILSRENLTLRESIITGNHAEGIGGGLFAYVPAGATVQVLRTTFEDNRANYGGGMHFIAHGSVTIDGSTFSGNHANASGGGIRPFLHPGSSAGILNSTISGNSAASWGGGLAVFASAAGLAIDIRHTTITANRSDENVDAVGDGGGIYVQTAVVNLSHTIVAANDDLQDAAEDVSGSTFTAEYTLIGNADGATITDGGGNQFGNTGAEIDPLLSPLANYGGITLIHALLPGSPAIDRGNPGAIAGSGEVPLADQRGVGYGRVMDIPGGGPGIDLGAYEVQAAPTTLVVDTLLDELDSDFSAGDLSLREAIGWANTFGAEQILGFIPGVDVSRFQQSINWATVADEGIEFAFVKATEGSDLTDVQFVNYANGASAQGILVGPYHFARLDTDIATAADVVIDAVSEANHFVDVIEPYYQTPGPFLTPVIDIEDGAGQRGVPDSPPAGMTLQAFVSAWTRAFAEVVENRLGVTPIIYGNSVATNNYYEPSIADDFDLWLARWTNDPAVLPTAANTGIWNGDWKFWQWTATGMVPGIQGNDQGHVDRDVFDGTMRELLEYVPNPLPAAVPTISFDASLGAGKIDLSASLGEIDIAAPVIIDAGVLAGGLTIDAGDGADGKFSTLDGFRIFNIDDGTQANIDVTIVGLTLTGGDVEGDGGAILSRESLTLRNSRLTGNSARHNNQTIGLGGGLFAVTENTAADVVIENTTVEGNWANYGGGTFIDTEGSVTITSSTIAANFALWDGGGIYAKTRNDVAQVEILNSTISGNTANGHGGGVAVITTSAVSMAIRHSTITANIADNNANGGDGGGVFSPNPTFATRLDHTIVAGNVDISGGTIPDAVGVDPFYSLIGDNAGSGLVEAATPDAHGNLVGGPVNGPIAPLLGPLTDNGGPTFTHALAVGSPAIDAGNSAISAAPANDQRGAPFARILDGDGDATGVIDIGAFERAQPVALTFPLVVDTLEDNDDGDYGAGDLSLREAIALANANPGADTITFDSSLNGGNIFTVLSLLHLAIADSVTIDATGLAGGLTISARSADDTPGQILGDGSRIFFIDDGNDANHLDVEIAGLTLTGGDAFGDGAAIYSRENLTLRDSVVTGNASAGIGGGLFAYVPDGAHVDVLRTTFSNNRANYGGGLHFIAHGSVTVDSSTFSFNSAAASGGGVRPFLHPDGSALIVNTTISFNFANRDGGGIAAFAAGPGPALDIRHSTITLNRSDEDSDAVGIGGGIHVVGATVNLSHTIVAGNNDRHNMAEDVSGSTFTAEYTIVGNADGSTIAAGAGIQFGSTTSPIDPLLGPLADNGGPTRTHALMPGSPAIDKGNAAITSPPASDQRGAPFVRVFDDSSASGSAIDIGAYEQQSLPGSFFVVDTLVDENDADYSPGDLSLREAIVLAHATGFDAITFAPSLGGGAIELAMPLGELVIRTSMTIDANSLSAGLTIDAADGADGIFNTGDGVRIFRIDDNDNAVMRDVKLVGLRLIGGDNDDDGGAILSRENLTIINSKIIGNASEDDGDGGGIRIESGNLTLANSEVRDNSASTGRGGGIAITGPGHHAIINSTITGNVSDGDGAGIYNRSGSLTLLNSTISNNSSGRRGGGILNQDSDLFVTNSTISGNSALQDGGGIYLATFSSAFTTAISHATITLNYADAEHNGDGRGGGIYIRNDRGSAITIDHTIVAQNTRSITGDDDLTGVSDTISANWSLFEAVRVNVDGSDNLFGLDPLLGPLQDNGGFTFTHALLPGSPAIDAGDPAFAPPPDYDQRGMPFDRVVDGDGDSSARIDIGAYEAETPVIGLVVSTLDDEDDGIYTPGDLSLREAIALANADAGTPETITFAPELSGGTIHLDTSLGELAITDSLIIDASSLDQGVAIDAADPSPLPNNGIRIFNIDDGGPALIDVELVGLTLTGADLDGRGGAVFTRENLMLTKVVVVDNWARQGGGGVAGETGSLTIRSSTVADNRTQIQGGGVRHLGPISVVDSTISGNTAAAGGGLFIEPNSSSETVQIIQSTISGNRANEDAGGVWLRHRSGGTATIAHSTITANRAETNGDGTGQGGGIVVSRGELVLDHTIVAQNIAPTGKHADITLSGTSIPDSGTLVATFNLIGDNAGSGLAEAQTPDANGNRIGSAAGAGVINALLGPLADNGGGTLTHALLAGSPAIDAGDAGFSPPPASDQRGDGFARVLDGNGLAGPRIDIGSVEAPESAVSADFDADGDADGWDFLAWQRGFGTPAPDAVRGDGDADNDADVDGADLAVWTLQFGSAEPLQLVVALASSVASLEAADMNTPTRHDATPRIAEPSIQMQRRADLMAEALAFVRLQDSPSLFLKVPPANDALAKAYDEAHAWNVFPPSDAAGHELSEQGRKSERRHDRGNYHGNRRPLSDPELSSSTSGYWRRCDASSFRSAAHDLFNDDESGQEGQ